MASHDLHHPNPIRRTARGFRQYRRYLFEILRANEGRGHHAEHFDIGVPQVIESMHRAARYADRLTRTDFLGHSIHGHGEDTFEAKHRLLVLVVAMGGGG